VYVLHVFEKKSESEKATPKNRTRPDREAAEAGGTEASAMVPKRSEEVKAKYTAGSAFHALGN